MSTELKRPIVFDYFSKSANVLLSDYERSKGQEASANLGDNRELFCSKFLSRVLPQRLSIGRGEIWDSQANRSGQLDVIVARDDMPLLSFGGEANTYLVEGVLAAIEVKSNLSRNELIKALTSLKHVKKLQPDSKTIITAGAVLDRPLCCVFAYEGATFATLSDELLKQGNIGVADLVCVLKRGVIISNKLLLSWSDQPLLWIEGRAAALAFLYFHLASFAAGFVARGMPIAPYFEPLNNWADK